VSVTIYHNPDCGTSRNTLAMIRLTGEEPEIIEYLKQDCAGPPNSCSICSTIPSSVAS
jgi:arsenate reductase-like glutaredoxin family protein